MTLSQAERKAALDRLVQRVGTTLEATDERFPLYAAADGTWETTDDGNWCAGYWIGLLWLASKHATGATRVRFRSAAHAHLPALLAQPTGHLFAGLNHAYAGFLGYDVTGEPQLRDIGIRGADAMLALYDARARHIPIGTYTTAPTHKKRTSRTPIDRSNYAAVDAIHTSVPVLLRAYRETGRDAYRDAATAHVKRHLEWHMRPDGSTTQMTTFDKATGEPIDRFSTLAASDDGCWSRGLGWHIAGLAYVCVATGDTDALAALRISAGYYAAHAGGDLVPAWDLTLTDPLAPRDASAAAIAAYGLLSLRGAAELPDADIADLVGMGERILGSLVRLYQVKGGANAGAIAHGCYRFPTGIATDNELIWTDFYVAAALDLQTDG